MRSIARDGSMAFLKRTILLFLKIVFTVGYGTLFTYVLFFARRRRHLTEHHLNLKPIKGTIDNYRNINPDGNHEYYNFYVNLLGNIALFIPFSIILFSLFGIRTGKKTMGIALITSILIEFMQFAFYRGVADVDDILLNMIGALLGCAIYKHLLEKWDARLTDK